jgi:hypothetical protein
MDRNCAEVRHDTQYNDTQHNETQHNGLNCYNQQRQVILKGKYHSTIDLLFDWFGLVCFANKNKNCLLSYS